MDSLITSPSVNTANNSSNLLIGPFKCYIGGYTIRAGIKNIIPFGGYRIIDGTSGEYYSLSAPAYPIQYGVRTNIIIDVDGGSAKISVYFNTTSLIMQFYNNMDPGIGIVYMSFLAEL